ncbi:endonuclease/exonuclease/phosphatase family protein, partial [uncultured Akkermansia sp.]
MVARIICSPGNTEPVADMKGNKWSIFRLSAAVAVFFSPFPLQAGEFTLMSYNVKNGTGMDGRRDYDRTARVIAAEKPDVVALQELDQGTIRSSGRDTLQELAARTTLTGTYAKAIDYSGGSYGVGILSREKPL